MSHHPFFGHEIAAKLMAFADIQPGFIEKRLQRYLSPGLVAVAAPLMHR